MFKQIFVILFSSIVSFFSMKYFLKKNYKRFYFIQGIVKYELKCKIKNAIYAPFCEIKNINNIIFYTTEKINCNNYIYDTLNNYYYLIEPGFYYYIKERSNLILNFDSSSFIFYLKIN